MKYEKQVASEHYQRGSYTTLDRWTSYFHQMTLVRSASPKTVLEVGVGSGVVARELRGEMSVTTVDIAEDLRPDVVGSVTELPFADGAFDVVLAAEILEHIQFTDVPQALKEIARVARTHAVISLPHPGYVFSINYKVPLLPRIDLYVQLPFFWKEHHFDGQHYWELGKRGYSIASFVALAAEAGLTLVQLKKYSDDPGHRFFLFKK